MSQKETGKNKRKKKKGTGLIVVCVTLLILLLAVLGILIWQIIRVGNGETIGFGGKTDGNTQMVSQTVPATQEAVQTSAASDGEGQTEAQTESAAQSESAATGQTQAAGQATMMEPQTYETDENGNMIIPARQAGSMESEPAWEYVLEKTGDTVLDDANYLAAMYDYDGAIAKIPQRLPTMSSERVKPLSMRITVPFHISSSILLLSIRAEHLMITLRSASRMV